MSESSESLADLLRPALVQMGLEGAARMMQLEAEADGDDAGVFAFAPGLLVTRTAAAFAKRATEAQARAFVAWTEHPDVAPFLALERETVEPGFDDRIDAFFDTQPHDPERFALVLEYIDRTDALARAADLAIYTLAAAIIADEADLPVEEQTALDDVIPTMLGTRDSIAESVRDEVLDTYVTLFHDTPIPEIRAYLHALTDPAAQWYYATIGRAFGDALVAAFREAAALED